MDRCEIEHVSIGLESFEYIIEIFFIYSLELGLDQECAYHPTYSESLRRVFYLVFLRGIEYLFIIWF